MASSRSSDHRRQHASSTSSVSSPTAQTGPRRITLTIPPLKLKLSNSNQSTVLTPSNDVPTPSSATSSVRQTPKIKIKPRASFAEPLSAIVESPVQSVPISLPPPTPTPKAKPVLPPPKPKVPRPIKLRPLKEVLSKLIAQIKKKDDYAFFLNPVDPDSVTGYADVVKNPMDFGTMTTKVETGKYRSLEQFKDDFLLVIANAKAFNPPSTLYHSEATRIEAWGMEHISRASVHVIEYETDWTIDVVADGEPVASTSELPAPDVVGDSLPTDKLDHDLAQRARSPSVISSVPGVNVPAEKMRRSRSKKITAVTESWEEGGHLPGHKDGLGMFPPRSDLSELMLDLKLKGKRFRTKKERLRREKEGPPTAPDGSLNYLEMEHPFSVLHQLVPDPPSLPLLAPLIDIQSESLSSVEATPAPKEASQPPEEKDTKDNELERMRPVRGPSSLPIPALSTILAEAGKNVQPNPPTASSMIGKKKLQHWTITRNPPRTRARDADDGEELAGAHLAKRRRVAEVTDYGPFAILTGLVAAENNILADDFDEAFNTEEKFLEQLKVSLDNLMTSAKPPDKMDVDGEKVLDPETVLDANEYIRDVVYGGVEGIAYIRSLADFVSPPDGDTKSQGCLLGLPLAQWIETHVVNPLTYGNHSILRESAQFLAGYTKHISPQVNEYLNLTNEDKTTLRDEFKALAELCSPEMKIDIAALLRAPNELFAAENEWSGVEYKARRDQARQEAENKRASLVGDGKVEELSDASGPAAQVSAPPVLQGSASDTADVIEHALDTGAQAILELDRRLKEGDGIKFPPQNTSEDEDALVRRTRLNLIAIAKRAPIDRIAHLPPELVPSHIRHIVPTLST